MEFIKKISYEFFQGKFAVYGQFVKFAGAGAICATIETLILITLKNLYGEEYLLTFNAIAYIIAVVINYLISRTWVFETGKHSVQVEFLAFCGVATVGLGLNQLIFYLALQQLTVKYYILAKMIAIAMVVVWNFFAKKHFVFKG